LAAAAGRLAFVWIQLAAAAGRPTFFWIQMAAATAGLIWDCNGWCWLMAALFQFQPASQKKIQPNRAYNGKFQNRWIVIADLQSSRIVMEGIQKIHK
jgi:hypothetical protein